MRDIRATFFLLFRPAGKNVRVFSPLPGIRRPEPEQIEPETRRPEPEPEPRIERARTRTYPEPGGPNPNISRQQASWQRRFNPNKLTPAGTTRIKKPPPKRGQLGGNPIILLAGVLVGSPLDFLLG